jgi:uncharacterized cupin superfamily protein
MGYHLLDPGALDPTPDFPSDRRSVSDACGLSTLAAAIYAVQPGEQLARAYHAHDQREELFYVVSGTLHVRTPERTFEVDSGRLFVVEPGNPILPHVPETASAPARVLGVGAPSYDPGRPYDPDG